MGQQHRKYGQAPFKVILVHGGPGAVGEMAEVARELAADYGIIESLHTGLTVQDQIDELKSVILNECSIPVCLIGFSWGAWLCLLFSVQYGNLIGQLVLIGCGPLEAKYATEIYSTRLNRLNTNEKHQFKILLDSLQNEILKDKNSTFRDLGKLIHKTDTFQAIRQRDKNVEIFPEVFTSVWKEAEQLRKNGILLEAINKTELPIFVIHGDYDPHPITGIIKPIQHHARDFHYKIIDCCGHKPWIEKYARNHFFRLLREIIDHYPM
jgi:pimeloyl-ACP methyl ester carboxylesterase